MKPNAKELNWKFAGITTKFAIITGLIWWLSPFLQFGESRPFADPSIRLVIIGGVLILWGISSFRLAIKYIDTSNNPPHTPGFWQLLKEITPWFFKNKLQKNISKPWTWIIGDTKSGKSTIAIKSGHSQLETCAHSLFQAWKSEDGITFEVSIENCHSLKILLSIFQVLRLGKTPADKVLIAIPPQDLVNNKLQSWQKTLGSALNSKKFKKSPVQIVVTQADQIPGFIAFSSSISKLQQELPFGFKLTDNLTTWNTVFHNTFQKFIDELHKHLITELHKEHDLSKRQTIAEFPLQITQYYKFIEQTCRQLHMLGAPAIEAVYWTSCINKNESNDLISPCIETKFPTIRANIKNFEPIEQTFFVHHLFKSFNRKQKIGSKKKIIFACLCILLVGVISFNISKNKFNPLYLMEKNQKNIGLQLIPNNSSLFAQQVQLEEKYSARSLNNQLEKAGKDQQKQILSNFIARWKEGITNIQLQKIDNLYNASKYFQEGVTLTTALNSAKANIFSNHNPAYVNIEMRNQFPRLTELTEDDLTNLKTNFENLAAKSKTWMNSDNPEKEIFKFVKNRFATSDKKVDSLDSLLLLSAKLPSPLDKSVFEFAESFWKTALAISANYIHVNWKNDIYPAFAHSLQNKYPFAINSNQGEISLNNLYDFIGPKGKLTQFMTNYIKDFTSLEDGKLRWKQLDGAKLKIDDQALDLFAQSRALQQMFYDKRNTADHPEVGFTLIATDLSPQTSQVILDIQNSKIIASPSDMNVNKVKWTGLPNPTASLEFITDKGKTEKVEQTGDWAWFKLLDGAHINGTDDPRRFNVIFDLNGHAAKFILIADLKNNPFELSHLHEFTIPKDL